MHPTILILGTIFLALFSLRSLRYPGCHGFYRFFAFEGILLLLLSNQPYWFTDPFSAQHLLSWLLLLLSIIFVVQSVYTLRRLGGHGRRQEMPGNLPFENTTQIVTTGLYRTIRHPMYSSLLFLGWGAFLKNIDVVNIGLVLLVTGFLIATARVEERENLQFFGAEYAEYMRRTRMFIPWLL